MRFLCKLQLPRWSMLVAPLFYVLFMLFILNLAFPLSSLGGGGGSANSARRRVSGGNIQSRIDNNESSASADQRNRADEFVGGSANDVAYRVEPKPHSMEVLQQLKESFFK